MSDIARSLIARRLRHLSLLPEGEYCQDIATIQMYLTAFCSIEGTTRIRADGAVEIKGNLQYTPPKDIVAFKRIPLRFANITGTCRVTESLDIEDIRGIEKIGGQLIISCSNKIKWIIPAAEVSCTSLDYLTSENLIALLNAKTVLIYCSQDNYGKTIARAINAYHKHQDTLTLLTDLAEYPNLIRGLLSYEPVVPCGAIDTLDLAL